MKIFPFYFFPLFGYYFWELSSFFSSSAYLLTSSSVKPTYFKSRFEQIPFSVVFPSFCALVISFDKTESAFSYPQGIKFRTSLIVAYPLRMIEYRIIFLWGLFFVFLLTLHNHLPFYHKIVTLFLPLVYKKKSLQLLLIFLTSFYRPVLLFYDRIRIVHLGKECIS